ncbi:RNA 3'-terminal phosphate cyclase/enolpyruvate transferase [Cladorrhinum sp. PSN259]|nr:RNA 3'-terminal phosphate cyclase/enolpyruvate transferase [Cladorrhinum sp. PSN259]
MAIDGTMFEGGGGLVRYAIAYAAILNRPVHIHSIRANRPGVGGLRSEHTIAVNTLALLTSAKVEGNETASRELTFTPHAGIETIKGNYPSKLDITIRGAAGIFMIAMLPYILFSQLASKVNPSTTSLDGIELTIRAGTLCVRAPSIIFIRQVFLPTMELIGIGKENIRLLAGDEQGWHTDTCMYPGKITVRLTPLKKPLDGFVLKRRGMVRVVRATAHVPRRVVEQFEKILRDELYDAVAGNRGEIKVVVDMFESDPDDQYHLLIVAACEQPAAYIGYEEVYPQRDVFPKEIEGDDEKIGLQLVRACIHGLWVELRSGNAVSEYMEDMLAIYQSLAVGLSSAIAKNHSVEVPEFNLETPAIKSSKIYGVDKTSLHRETSWWMVESFTEVRQEIVEIDGEDRVACYGVGLGS